MDLGGRGATGKAVVGTLAASTASLLTGLTSTSVRLSGIGCALAASVASATASTAGTTTASTKPGFTAGACVAGAMAGATTGAGVGRASGIGGTEVSSEAGEGLAGGAGIGEGSTTSSNDGIFFSSPVGSGVGAIDSSVWSDAFDTIIAAPSAVGVEDAARMFTTEVGTRKRVRRGRIIVADSRGETKRRNSR